MSTLTTKTKASAGVITTTTKTTPATVISRDASSKSAFTTGTTVTWSHTCAAGAKLFVFTAGTNTGTPISITYGGDALTQCDLISLSGVTLSAYFLSRPKTGANNIIITWSGSKSGGGMAVSYFGPSFTQPDDDGSTLATGVSTPLTVAPFPIATGCWIAGIFYVANTSTETISGQGTILQTVTGVNGTSNDVLLLDSNGTVTGSGTLGITSGTGKAYALSFAPFIAITTITKAT